MLALFGTGVWLWFLYGLLRMSGPIMLANAVTGIQVLAILAIKIRHGYIRRRATSARLGKFRFPLRTKAPHPEALPSNPMNRFVII